MTPILGQTETDIGTVIFAMNAGHLEIKTPKKKFMAFDENIRNIDGKFIFRMPWSMINGYGDHNRNIEIPADVMKQRDEIQKEIKKAKDILCKIETANGPMYFSIGENEQIVIKCNEKTVETNTIYTIEGSRAVCVPELGFLVVPRAVEAELNRIKEERERRTRGLVYAGQSLLTKTDYYKLNYDPGDTLDRVKNLFMVFEPGDVGNLKGLVTPFPEKVEERLKILNTISSRKEEIEKQKEQAAKDNKRIIEKLMKAC
ncbi:hypothetical protein [Methanosarcina mazei]|uniref:Uncharacterized protein n=1 Tax=Methanosarcina mazei TaxID=2209 RepID=A0A0F8IFN5_METMZ|nr:hypothetical protein [Methanosarcina mazei]KKG49239.1 hypothetical protein DU33_16140 [Methanosarcina mazei]KKG62238.1 hypothetical protein DU45_19080 [Methanosarcina mazei]KKG66205.1 hypothetical protein DU64_15435 [Methanosarcina mazei]